MEKRDSGSVRMDFRKRHQLITWLRDIDVVGVRLFANTLPKLILPKPRGEMVLETIHGFELHLDPEHDTGVERSIYYTGTYEKGTLHVIKGLLRPGDTFVDVGANIGLMSIFASRCVGEHGRVLAYEPNPATCAILERNVALNTAKNVKVLPFAVGSSNTTGVIHDHVDPNRGRATMVASAEQGGGHAVAVVALDSHLKDEGRITLIKMDIEGYELEALKGMSAMLGQASPPGLIIEYSELRENTFGREARPIYDHLKSFAGYRFFRTTKSKERVSRLVEVTDPDRFPQHDNIYCLSEELVQRAREHSLLPRSTKV